MSDLLSTDIEEYLKVHENKELLRFITCGSVDDGKSTLIGRLLHDSKMIFEDQLEAITKDSKKSGTTGEKVDLALLVDGLASEREQGITIDVAYRYFTTDKRKFIIADTPGHEQYTRNMATGASTADLAIILIDARHGIQTQTKRHSYITSLLGIKHTVIAINKMDLVDFSEEVYEKIKTDYLHFAKEVGIKDATFIPLSALDGDNIVNKSEKTPWYKGEPLLSVLENIEIANDINFDDFRFPVQYVNRPNLDFRGFSGTIASGVIKVGDEVVALPSNKKSTIKSIVTYDGNLQEAYAPMAVTLTLNDEIDISRGDVIVKSDNVPDIADEFDVHVVWMNDTPLNLGDTYEIKKGTSTISGFFEEIHYKKDVNTLEHISVDKLELNDIGYAKLILSKSVVYDSYDINRQTGRFIIIEKYTNKTVGAGMIKQKTQGKKSTLKHSDFEIEFNALVRKHFPHWGAKDISKIDDFII
ncbi:sulfate adenylyltransferase subunit CysN [Sulfurospirillum arcachonense]|uniref:sulfate adenylyltransferase subunit CysN n=1 Tax=Sulfurospirillum arcachonense TaxID=57666 RepID=UPI0004B83F93|nr:sulfate adenylyltransferase subunit CysN [Sulfurospirillum arcachonense]